MSRRHLKQELPPEEQLKELGHGSFATVYLMRSVETNAIYASKQIKIGQLSPEKRAKVLKETTILRTLKHPHVVRMFQCYEQGDLLHVHMEFVDGGDLDQLIKSYIDHGDRMPEARIISIFAQLCHALEYVHSQKVLHRDIKPTNCFVEAEGSIAKLGDFGLGDKLSFFKTQTHGFIGTPYYMAPEVLREEDYDYKADIWSMGVMLYEMVRGHKPCQAAQHLKELKDMVANERYKRLVPDRDCSRSIVQIVQDCLQLHKSKRPTAADLCMLDQINASYRELHPYAGKHRSGKRGVISCKIAHMSHGAFQEDKLIGPSLHIDSLLSSSTPRQHESVPDSAWKSAKLVEHEDGFMVKSKSLFHKTFFFPRPGDKIVRVCLDDAEFVISIIRHHHEYLISFRNLQELMPLMSNLENQAVLQSDLENGANGTVQVYDQAISGWTNVFFLTWKQHLFIGSREWNTTSTSILCRQDAPFNKWPLEADRHACLVLQNGRELVPIVARSPAHARVLVYDLLQAHVAQTWEVRVFEEGDGNVFMDDETLSPTSPRRVSTIMELPEGNETTAQPAPKPNGKPVRRGRSTTKRRSGFFSRSSQPGSGDYDLKSNIDIEIRSPMRATMNAAGEIRVFRRTYFATMTRADFLEYSQSFSKPDDRDKRRSLGSYKLQGMDCGSIEEYFKYNLAMDTFEQFWLSNRIPRIGERQLFEGGGRLPSRKGSNYVMTVV
ncbi:uncharacterized protein MONBRDRAFT_34550 [Monosiga brevicollis MX1]|uniref:non-specific serine/threonine protein kinase n=1 Tax=Monosiga brevicollis TaxID=81824 RepID=A9VCH4_MONBE|nr:uncharacterized protein MONBRDRAFT_34550 [Monosiga brevicollis MX1]EDQ84784.1 predicted protein [Monosiga brevicollis MX1]|eukprot:XP_001750434.1 hypothetical protein [Monosiga brevicollis MX1]